MTPRSDTDTMEIDTQSMTGGRDVPFAALIEGRRSVRRFRPDAIDRRLVERVVDAGRWAPCGDGAQPWRFVILTQFDIRTRLADAMSAAWTHNLAMDGQDPDVIARRLKGSRQRLLETPVLILLCLYLEDLDRYPDNERQATETTMAVQSLGACAQNMLLAAYRLGLDTGWMCAPLFCPEVVRDTLELSESHVPHALLQLGHAATDPKRRPRRPLHELITLWR
ncbi:nitroreductase family protein [soil metagenome]